MTTRPNVREALEDIVGMIANCAGVPTNPDSLVQMVKVRAEQGLAALSLPPERDEVGEKEIAQAIRHFCSTLSANAVQASSDGVERAYYSGIPLNDLARAILSRLSRLVTAQEWQPPETLPPVEIGNMRELIVAVYRQHSGKVYSFAASYLNGYRLQYEDCPKGKKQWCDECEDGCPTTGWFIQTGDEDYASRFETLSLKDGDKLLGWRPVPQWPGLVPPLPTSPSPDKAEG